MAIQALLAALLEKTPEEAAALTLEEAAVCALMGETGGDNTAAAQLAALAREWVRHGEEPVHDVAARRRQPILRALVAACVAGRASHFQGDEVAFIRAAHDLARAARFPRHFERLCGLIGPCRANLDALHNAQPVDPATPGLASLIHVVTTEELEAAPPRQAQEFAGIAMAIRGRVFTHRGSVRVLGDIPDNCTVAVEQGDCYVDGYVLGNLAATGSCEVRGNVAGVAIARLGDVRARDVINHAKCISKQGRAVCMNAMQPGLVYGFAGVAVWGEVRGGVYMGGSFSAAGAVTGGEIHVTGRAEAARFACAGSTEMAIILRHSISHSDYGELVSREAARMVGKAYRLRQRLDELDARVSILQSEIEQFAANTVLYAAGGEQAREQVQMLQQAERRLAFLDRIIAGVDAMVRATDLRLSAARAPGEEGGEALESLLGDDALAGWVQELGDLEQEGGVEEDLLGRRDEMVRLHRGLRGKSFQLEKMTQALIALAGRAAVWRAERKALHDQAAALARETATALGKVALVEKATALGAVQVLGQLRGGVAKNPGSPLAERFRAPFARVLFRNIDTRLRHIRDIHASRERIAAEYASMRETLQRQYQLHVPPLEGDEPPEPTEVMGCFDEGVRIFGAMHAFDAQRDSSPCVCVTEQEEEPASFRRGAGDTVERV